MDAASGVPRGELLARGVEANAGDRVTVRQPIQEARLGRGLQVPHLRRVVGADGEKTLPIVAEAHPGDGTVVASKDPFWGEIIAETPRRAVPAPDDLIGARRGEADAVGAKRQLG